MSSDESNNKIKEQKFQIGDVVSDSDNGLWKVTEVSNSFWLTLEGLNEEKHFIRSCSENSVVLATGDPKILYQRKLDKKIDDVDRAISWLKLRSRMLASEAKEIGINIDNEMSIIGNLVDMIGIRLNKDFDK